MSQTLAMDEGYAKTLAEKKNESTAQLLFQAARRVNEYALAKVAARSEGPSPRASHMSLFPHIDLEGTRLTVLAERVGSSKQAVGQLVNDLEEMGLVERQPDPDDGRAKRVCFSAKGRDAILKGLMVLGEVETELEESIGQRHMRNLHQALSRTLSALESFGA